jgi:phospholipid/cholesterol/gamma-HCH transport system substrate-binding protein
VDRDTPLTTDTFATLSYQGVTGLAFIQLADEGKPAPRLAPNDEVPPRIPLRPGILARLEEHGEVILQRVEEVTGRVDQLLGDANQKRITDALENISSAANSTRQLVGHVDTTLTKKLDPALDQFGVTLRGAQRTVSEIGATAQEFRQTAQRLNAPGGPLDRVSQGTDALASTMETFSTSTLPRLNRVADETTRTVRTLDRAIDQLTENPQMLIYGRGPAQPGPGEPGFQAQGAGR